jgi:hypothetical protein
VSARARQLRTVLVTAHEKSLPAAVDEAAEGTPVAEPQPGDGAAANAAADADAAERRYLDCLR